MKKLFKKTLAVIMVAAMLLCIVPFTASASYSGTCGDNLTWTFDGAGTLTISGSGPMYDYESGYSTPWVNADFDYSQLDIHKVVIGDGVTHIGDYAFSNHYNIRQLDLGNSVKSIGTAAFRFLYDLEELSLPNGLTEIGPLAFYYCSNVLSSVTIPSTVTTIGQEAFSYCISLENIVMPDKVLELGRNIFYSTAYYRNIENWEDGVLYIGNHLVQASDFDVADDNIVSGSYTVKTGTKSIAAFAFYYCDKLTAVTIPASVGFIGQNAFAGCSNTTTITVNENNPNYSSDNRGALFDKNKAVLMQYPQGNTVTSYTVPSTVKEIGTGAFYSCKNLTSITMQSGITKISSYAFESCNGLTGLKVPNTVTAIDDYAFLNCSKLNYAHIPSSVESMGVGVFNGCKTSMVICSNASTSLAKEYADNLGATFEVCDHDGAVHTHSYTATITRTATCTQSGIKTYSCSCGNSYTETIPVKSHTPGSWIVAVEPTLEADGVKVKKCTGCGIEMETGGVSKLMPAVTVEKTSTTTVNYGDTLVIKVGFENITEGMCIEWFVEGVGISTKVNADGTECRVTSIANGSVTITAKLVDENGEPVTNADGEEIFDQITLTSKAGFWQKLVSFFKNLFGANRIIY